MGMYIQDVDVACEDVTSLCWEQYLQSRGVVEWWRDTCLQLSDWYMQMKFIHRASFNLSGNL